MTKDVNITVEYQETLRNLARLDDKRRRELKRIVTQSTKNIENNMANIISREATDTGRLANSIRSKRTNPKAYRPIPKEERGLFKSVHTRNRTGRHWTFTDSGTVIRRANRLVNIGGKWVRITHKGSIDARNFRERARQMESINFNRKVLEVASRNESV